VRSRYELKETMMPDPSRDHAAETQRAQEPRYPTNHVVAVIDREVPLAEAVESLTGGGFLETEFRWRAGPKWRTG
jgi:hypothetical protein